MAAFDCSFAFLKEKRFGSLLQMASITSESEKTKNIEDFAASIIKSCAYMVRET